MAAASDQATNICSHWGLSKIAFLPHKVALRFCAPYTSHVGLHLAEIHTRHYLGLLLAAFFMPFMKNERPLKGDVSYSDRAIPSSNLDLHVAHCSRKLEKCKICGDVVPKKHAEEHFLSTHAPVACSLYSETMEPEVLVVHKGEKSPQRIVTCEYCEFPLPAIDLFKHQEVCGNRTELCHLYSRYTRLHEIDVHVSRCNGSTNIAESSRNTSPAERYHHGTPRRQPDEASRKRLLYTIAITGIAVLFGSLIFQKKAEDNQVV